MPFAPTSAAAIPASNGTSRGQSFPAMGHLFVPAEIERLVAHSGLAVRIAARDRLRDGRSLAFRAEGPAGLHGGPVKQSGACGK